MTTQMTKDKPEYAYARFRPAVDIHEGDRSFKLVLDLPGVSKDDVDVGIEQDMLYVSAKRSLGVNEPIIYERQFGLPSSVERDKIEAEMKAGVLTLTLPKHASTQPKQIKIKAA